MSSSPLLSTSCLLQSNSSFTQIFTPLGDRTLHSCTICLLGDPSLPWTPNVLSIWPTLWVPGSCVLVLIFLYMWPFSWETYLSSVLLKANSFASVSPRPDPIRTQREELGMSLTPSSLCPLLQAWVLDTSEALTWSLHSQTIGAYKESLGWGSLRSLLGLDTCVTIPGPSIGMEPVSLTADLMSTFCELAGPREPSTTACVSLSVTFCVTYRSITT